MSKMKDRMSIAVLALAGEEEEGRPFSYDEVAELYNEAKAAAEAGNGEAVESLQILHKTIDAALNAMLAMTDEVGEAISEGFRSAVEGEYSIDANACEEIWQAAIRAVLK